MPASDFRVVQDLVCRAFLSVNARNVVVLAVPGKEVSLPSVGKGNKRIIEHRRGCKIGTTGGIEGELFYLKYFEKWSKTVPSRILK